MVKWYYTETKPFNRLLLQSYFTIIKHLAKKVKIIFLEDEIKRSNGLGVSSRLLSQNAKDDMC